MFPKYVLLSICAFIRVHFGRPGKFHSVHPSGVHTFFSKTSYDRRIFLSIKSRKSSLSKTCWFFIFYFPSFSPYLLSLSSLFIIFIMIFVCFIFLDDVPKRKTLHGSRISNIIDSNDINTNATIQTKMYALYK